ncbi:MAG: D-alanyl-D-alanine carboxypeptidase family protein, partial [Clostridia bacterium]|nr:D-alanyl-D-alanine carboxypeptidase family protein [Clostridia bacterium]
RKGSSQLNPSFGKTKEGQWVNENAHRFGFIVRYLEGYEEVTGYMYEPWHVRYVGAPHAAIMTDSGLTLEEYVELLVPNTWYQSGDYWIARLSADAMYLPSEFTHCDVSPDNTGYYIVTVQK